MRSLRKKATSPVCACAGILAKNMAAKKTPYGFVAGVTSLHASILWSCAVITNIHMQCLAELRCVTDFEGLYDISKRNIYTCMHTKLLNHGTANNLPIT